ncbi:MAG: hypothetical protein U1A25_02515 [Candidatus Sungbacteria bacterium]|nr:hypothetical protein [bacterium]MDZ4260514.1 hypothetical protein [Candidatus Sungbacteria bacterium]
MKITIPDIMIPLIRTIRTKEEKDILRDQMIMLEAALFRSETQGYEKILQTRLPEHIAAAMRDILAQPSFKEHPEATRTFFQDLKNMIDILPVVKLSLAFNPSEEMIQRLHEWIQKNRGVGVVLDISYDAMILGGARMIFQGRYKEMTLSQMITDALAKEKTDVLKLIK